MDNKWRHWMAKCLLMGHSDTPILDKLLCEGYERDEILRELEIAKSSPYEQGAREVLERELSKQDEQKFEVSKAASNQAWLLKTYETLARLDPDYGQIQRIEAPSFEVFTEQYICKNRPVIITGAVWRQPIWYQMTWRIRLSR